MEKPGNKTNDHLFRAERRRRKLRKQSEKRKATRSFTVFYAEEARIAAVRESTRRNHLSTLALLREFKEHVEFEEVTFGFIVGFEHFLYTKKLRTNTVAKHLKQLKRYINSAISHGYMDAGQSPFGNYRIKTEATRCRYLHPQEMAELEQLILKDGKGFLQQTLDVFLFCCYTGLRYSDFRSLHPSNIVCMGDETWLMYRSPKTGMEQRLPLHLLFGGKAMAVLGKYSGRLAEFFSLQDNSNVNKKLLKIAHMAGIGRISFHTARHTNATLLLHKGVNIAAVQRILGHKSIKTTQIYAHMMDETLVNELKRVFSE